MRDHALVAAYDRAPFLEGCLNDGFLQDRNEFEIIGRRWIERYFTHPQYYKIDGKPLLSVFRPQTMVEGLGGIEATRDALRRLGDTMGLTGDAERAADRETGEQTVDLYTALPFASLTNYQWVSMATPEGAYADWSKRALAGEKIAAERYTIPFFPSVSVGWDNNARFPGLKEGYVLERTPELFRDNLKAAKAAVDERGLDPKLILINAWNEWTEDSYLLPDREFGYGYLEAVRDVFGGGE